MLIIKPTHLWFLSFMLCLQDLSAVLAHMDFLVPKACFLLFSEKTNIRRLFSTILKAGNISHFSSFWCVPTPRAVSAEPALQGFSSSRAVIPFFLQTWLYRPLGGLWQALRSYGVDSSFLFPDFSFRQADTRVKQPRLLQKKLGLRRRHELLICLY